MTADGTAITTGELSRAVALIRTDIGHLRADVASRPSTADVQRIEDGILERIRGAQALADLCHAGHDRDIKDLRDWQTWALRLGGPGVVGALIGVVLNASRISSPG